MASAEFAESTAESIEQTENGGDGAEICDNILLTHRSMPDKTVSPCMLRQC